RYCADKSLRASAAAVYWRTIRRIHEQRLWMAGRVEARHREHAGHSFSQVRFRAAEELQERETAIFPHYSLLDGHDRSSRLPRRGARLSQPLQRDSCGFPSPLELFRRIGVRDWFARLSARGSGDTSKRYVAGRESLTLPTMSLQVIARRPAGVRRVFDL